MSDAELAVKDRFSAVDTLAVAAELQRLVGARLDKAFDAPPHGYALSFRPPREGRWELVLSPGRFAALLDHPTDHAEELSPLARELRRLLAGAQLVEVSDTGGERYLELRFRRAGTEEGLRLAVELFGAGNVVVARGETIVAVEQTRRWAHRTVRIGSPYARPPSRTNPLALSISDLERALRESRTNRVSTLAARCQLGGPVAEELLARASLAPETAAPTDAERAAPALHRALAELLAELGDTPQGYLYGRGGVRFDVEPFGSRRWRRESGVEETVRPRFSEAAFEYFSALPALRAPEPSPADEASAELIRQIGRQESAVESLSAAIGELKAKADAILAHYTEVEARVADPPADATDGIFDIDLDGRTVPIRVGRPVRESAQALYDEAKRLQGKLAGAREALRETTGKLELVRSSQPAARPGPTGPRPPRSTPRWFERYRWFLSSEGLIVIGGRDAASNDLIVRRYLKPGDVYVHADIHGAPSVIVKHPAQGEPPATEITLTEAAQFGVAFSKAWRAGHAAGTAFWVNPDQVSKAGASGEFVPRGAWVIHGTKNYIRDVPTELGLGTVPVDGEPRWCVGPPSALRTRGELRFLLNPGEERDRASREVELARELGLSREKLQSLLPPGGISLRRA